MNPFVSISVQPSYGYDKVLVAWRVLPGFEDSMFFIYRSMTGTSPWKMLNEVRADALSGDQAVPVLGSSFEDDEFIVENRVVDTHYRMMMRDEGGQEYDSPPVSMFGKLTRKQWGGACKIMGREHLRMCAGNGIEVLHFIPLTYGELSPRFDSDTGQQLGPECPDTGPDDAAYGQKYIGGFGPPVQTFIEFRQMGPITMKDTQEGRGHDDDFTVVRARMLTHPKPQRGHMVVHPPSDNRYVVGETIQGYYFRGTVAVAYDVQLHLLRRNDPRYRVPIPIEANYA